MRQYAVTIHKSLSTVKLYFEYFKEVGCGGHRGRSGISASPWNQSHWRKGAREVCCGWGDNTRKDRRVPCLPCLGETFAAGESCIRRVVLISLNLLIGRLRSLYFIS